MEIEKKFRIDDPKHLDTLTTLRTLGTCTLRQSSHAGQQRNTYYDTADGLLERQKYGLRIREVDGRSVATLKGPGEGEAGLFRRSEWEVEASNPEPSTWPEGEARTQALALLQDAPLVPVLTIYTQRRHIIALRGDSEVAEISLDQGSFQADEQREPFCELEIELLPAGTDADIDALEAAIKQHIPLVAENRSKFARAMMLLNTARQNASER
jgi:triphosphatase